MNILIIPSWYPWHGEPLRGIFLKEQALGIGRVRPEWKIAVAVWGQRRYTLSVRNPFKTAAVLADLLLSRIRSKKHFLLPNVCEYHQPTIEWSKKWKQGNIKGQEFSCNRILKRAERDFGHIDLIHAHVTFPGGWIAMKLSRRFEIPYLITEHMGDFPFLEFRNADGTIKKTITKPLLQAQAIVAVSPSQAECIASQGFPKPRVIPNLINNDIFKPGIPVKKTPGEFVFFSLATLRTGKGIHDLLQAVAIFLQALDDPTRKSVEFRIGGDGDEAKDLHALGKELRIDPWLRWLGSLNRKQVLGMFQNCDCFVLPSHRESFGMALLEALACGKPVIATRCGGSEFMVTPENGILVGRQNPAELSRAMEDMLRNHESYDSSLIRLQALERFSPTIVTGQLEIVYRKIARKEPTRP